MKSSELFVLVCVFAFVCGCSSVGNRSNNTNVFSSIGTLDLGATIMGTSLYNDTKVTYESDWESIYERIVSYERTLNGN